MKNKEADKNDLLTRLSESSLLKPIKILWQLFLGRMKKSIRFQLVVVFGVCLIISLIAWAISANLFLKSEAYTRVDYSSSLYDIQHRADNLAEALSQNDLSSYDTVKIHEIINDYFTENASDKAIIVDLEGNVIASSGTVSETKVDVYSMIKSFLDSSNEYNWQEERDEVYKLYTIELKDMRTYLLVSAIPSMELITESYFKENAIVAYSIAFIVFIASFLVITNNKMKYIQDISKGLKEVSTGNFNYRIEKKSDDELGDLASNINYMVKELQIKIENERKAEKTKSDLITNVSHDLRTPLTSVMGYLGLVKEGSYENNSQLKEYITIAYNKAERLKVLIDDLFEYTKLTNAGTLLELKSVNICEFLEQLIEELRPDFEENKLDLELAIPEEKIYVDADINKLLRVFENLFTNSIKYSYKPGKVEISLETFTETVLFKITNPGEHLSKEKLKRIFERFYRADEARNSTISGSGLGLAITKNIVGLHKGRVWADCQDNNISFYVQLPLTKENSKS